MWFSKPHIWANDRENYIFSVWTLHLYHLLSLFFKNITNRHWYNIVGSTFAHLETFFLQKSLCYSIIYLCFFMRKRTTTSAIFGSFILLHFPKRSCRSMWQLFGSFMLYFLKRSCQSMWQIIVRHTTYLKGNEWTKMTVFSCEKYLNGP